jgi:cytochrome c556
MRPGPSTPKLSLLLAFSLLPVALAAGAGERVPSIRAVMHKQYDVSKAPFKLIKKEMESPSPDWEKVRAEAEKFGALAASLEKNEPPWGTAESWRQFLGKHRQDAAALREAAEARDLGKLRAAHKAIAGACNACHRAHRSEPGR